MGYVVGDNVRPAGDYLLKILAEKGSVRYGEEFFDHTPEQETRLRSALGIDSDEDYGDDRHSPPIYADWAAGQLEEAGLVETEQLADMLPDGEPDYRITLTEKGRGFLASGEVMRYRDMDV